MPRITKDNFVKQHHSEESQNRIKVNAEILKEEVKQNSRRRYKLSCGQLEAEWTVDFDKITQHDLEVICSEVDILFDEALEMDIHDVIEKYLIKMMWIPMRCRYEDDYGAYTEELVDSVTLENWVNADEIEFKWEVNEV